MQNDVVLPVVLFGTTAVYIVSGVLATWTGPSLSDQIGQGELADVHKEELPRGEDLHERSRRLAAQREEGEREARQMLQARSDRRVREGGQPLDVEAELARLTAAVACEEGGEAELVQEVRELIIARNERRMRQGLEPLDVEREIARALAESALVS
jgi:hypothetical protein